MAASLEDVALQWEAAVGAGADIVEWRIDALGALPMGCRDCWGERRFTACPVRAARPRNHENREGRRLAAPRLVPLRFCDAGGWADLVDVEVGYRGAEEVDRGPSGENRGCRLFP